MKLGDFHIHSTFSDGKLTIPEIVDLFGTRGFSVIAITDHLCDNDSLIGKSSRHLGLTLTEATFPLYLNVIHHEAKRALKQYNMTVIPGVEITKNRILSSHSAHFIALGLTQYVDPNKPVKELLHNFRSQNCLTIAAHPVHTGKMEKQTLYLWNHREELQSLFDAWEVASGSLFFDEVKKSGLPMIASSDLHSLKHFTSWKTCFEGLCRQKNIFDAIKNQNIDFSFFHEGGSHELDHFGRIDLDHVAHSDELGNITGQNQSTLIENEQMESDTLSY